MDELTARAKQGDRGAIEELLSTIAPVVQRFGLRMCGNAHDADDVLQDTLINVAEHIAEFDGRASLRSWVFALTRSACARRHRGWKNRALVGDDGISEQPALTPSPEASAADQELSVVLLGALDALPGDYREVILLRDVEGLSAPEAAALLELSVDALKSRLHRARAALRTRLRPWLEATQATRASSCPDVTLLWSRKLEGDLSQADCAEMERHFEKCPACKSACDDLKQALLACRRVDTAAVPSDVQARVKAALEAWTSRAEA